MRHAFKIGMVFPVLLAAQQVPTIRVPVRLVSVPTLVYSAGNRLIPGLESTDFRVFDNGRLQDVTLDTTSTRVSLAVAIQVNQEVREYVPFIAKVGSVLDALLAGESGETAVIAYRGEVETVKPFGSGDVGTALARIPPSGRKARMIDAGMRALAMLKERPASHARVLLLIGQPMDDGSESGLDALREGAEAENVTVYAVALPELNKAFVSDTFSLQGLSSRSDRGGFQAGVDLGKLIPTASRGSAAEAATDPFSTLTGATGGRQFHVRKQRELEGALATMGVELRSTYLLSYTPSSTETGYHNIRVEVDVPGAKAYARPGYWMSRN